MADLDQDQDSLELRILELETTIEDKLGAKRRIALDTKRMELKKKKYEQSLVEIDAQIAVHETDIASLKEAIGKIDKS